MQIIFHLDNNIPVRLFQTKHKQFQNHKIKPLRKALKIADFENFQNIPTKRKNRRIDTVVL